MDRFYCILERYLSVLARLREHLAAPRQLVLEAASLMEVSVELLGALLEVVSAVWWAKLRAASVAW